MRRFSFSGLALAVAMFSWLVPAASRADAFRARHGMSAVDFELQALSWMAEGWRPRTLDAATAGGSVVYAGIWEPYDPHDPAQRYTFDLDMTVSELQAAHDDLAPKGYHPVSVAGYEVGSTPHFAVIWHRDASVAYYWRAQLSSDEYQDLFDTLAAENVCGPARNDRLVRSVLDNISGRPGGNGLLRRIAGLDTAPGPIDADPNGRMPPSHPTPGCRFRLEDVDAYLDSGDLRYIAVWVVEKGGYAARHGMDLASLTYGTVGSNLEMTKVSSSPDGANGMTYAAIWNVLPKEVRYTFPRLSSTDYQALFDLRGGEGYTLEDIAIEPASARTGGVLYTSVWKAPAGKDQLLELHWPLGGTPHHDWTLVNYQDHVPAAGSTLDWNGGSWLYDGHNGTDISLRNFQEMDAGIDVLAAEDGTVTSTVDGNFDRNTCGVASCNGCNTNGNMVFVQHANGQRTWYMHLKSGSIIVSPNQKVHRGQKLAEVGSSGNSSDAHLHFAVLKGPGYNLGVSGGDLIDPWEGPGGNSDNLWSVVPPYEATVLNILDGDVTDHQPSRCEVTSRPDHVGSFSGPYGAGARVYFWLQLGGSVSAENNLWIELHRPGNALQDTIDVPDAGYQYGYPAWWYSLSGLSAVANGTWRFDVVLNGQVQFSRTFNVSP